MLLASASCVRIALGLLAARLSARLARLVLSASPCSACFVPCSDGFRLACVGSLSSRPCGLSDKRTNPLDGLFCPSLGASFAWRAFLRLAACLSWPLFCLVAASLGFGVPLYYLGTKEARIGLLLASASIRKAGRRRRASDGLGSPIKIGGGGLVSSLPRFPCLAASAWLASPFGVPRFASYKDRRLGSAACLARLS